MLRGLPQRAAEREDLAQLERLGMGELHDRAAGKLSKGEKQHQIAALHVGELTTIDLAADPP